MRTCISLIVLAALTACTSEFDMQGTDPKEYYAAHPKKNKVETRTLSHEVRFARGSDELALTEKLDLREALHDVRPEASETIVVQFSPGQLGNAKRREALRTLLRSSGYTKAKLNYSSVATLGDDEARVSVSYAVVVLPDCPDWRLSPVTTYSNTSQGNFGCATTVNLGVMVADPRDLERGHGDVPIDTERAARAVNTYRTGSASTSGSADSGSDSEGDSGSNNATVPDTSNGQ